jgi:regulator of CtrA degradation
MAEPNGTGVVSIGSSLLKSTMFDALFRDAMRLVEDTTAYLDGEGREDSIRLSQGLAMGYATESMRLTTRLLNVTSWVLLVRALRKNEITELEFKRSKGRVLLWTGQKRDAAPVEGLPQKLLEFIAGCKAISDRVVRFDAMLEPSKASGEAPAEGTLKPLALVREKREE